MKAVSLGTEEFAEFGKTDTQILVLVLNSTEANAIIDNICELEESPGSELAHATKALRAILAPVARVAH